MSACAAGYADHVDADVALAFADATLAPAERGEVERRIDTCAACRAVIAAAGRDSEVDATKVERPASARPQPRERSMQLVAGEVVGRYVVERPLGAGGMGVVSLARDPELHRAVVIKLVRPDAFDDDLEARLRREAQSMAQLSHPNVVQIFDIGRHGDRVFLAMEFIAGPTLDAWLIERDRSADEIIAMYLQAGAGLEAAHRAGLLHRDFKPTNVLVDRNGVAKVTDFGLARALGTQAGRATAAMTAPRTSGVHAVLTHADSVVGTPAYMAPEQAAGKSLDARTDEYALALALLDALVGQQPTGRTVKPSQPPAEIEAALERVPARARTAIVRALSLSPDERWPDLATFLRELAPQRKERRWWPIVAGAALTIAAASTVFALSREGNVVSCVAEAPRVWAKSRARVDATLAADPREFATWHAAHVIGAIDKAAAELGTVEVARCEGTAVDVPCLEQRKKALAAIETLAPGDPWRPVQAIASCTPSDTAAADLARADALDRDAKLALANGDLEAAARDFEAAATIGERTGDDALRARAVLGQLEIARAQGDLGEARDQIRRLEDLLDKHGKAPRDVFRVATASAETLIELGDVKAAFAAIERATDVAKTTDETLRARALHAWALNALRWEPELAQREIDAALAAASSAGAAARTFAWTIAADLALDRKDAKAATAAVAELKSDKLRGARARALAGDLDGALQELAPNTGDVTTELRMRIARARILHDAGSHAEAVAELKPVMDSARKGLSKLEVANAEMLDCAARLVVKPEDYHCQRPDFVETGHPRAPLLARYRLLRPRPESSPYALEEAIEILAEANARPILVAELRLELVRNERVSARKRKLYATVVRPVFEAAGRTDEVRELDAILAEIERSPFPPTLPVDAGAPAPPRDASGDPWAP